MIKNVLQRKRRLLSSLSLLIILIIGGIALAQQNTHQKTWKFAVVCDTRGNNDNYDGKLCVNASTLSLIAQSIVDEQCELVIVPGDLVNGWWAHGNTSFDDEFKNWKKAMEVVYNSNIPVYTVRGNHENGRSIYPPKEPYTPTPNDTLIKAYMNAFGNSNPQNGPDKEKGLTYYFKHKNAFFVGLDEYIDPYKVNMPWLSDILNSRFNKKSTPHLFTFGHNPCLQVNHPDCQAFYKDQRDKFWNLIGSKGSRIYFCGHDHLYNRASMEDSSGNEIYQVLAGSCGAPFKEWGGPYKNPDVKGYYCNYTDYGYAIVTITEDQAIMEWKAWNSEGNKKWKTLDSLGYQVN